MSNPLEAVNLSATLPHASKAAWGSLPPRQGSSGDAPLQLTTQKAPAWHKRLPLTTLESDVLHAACRVSTLTGNASRWQHDSKQHMYEVLCTLALAIKAKDPQLYLHSRRVQSLANRLALAMHLPKEEVLTVGLAALLHDIGKISIDDALLQKTGSLTSQEFEVIKEHPAHGALILSHFRMLKHVVPMVYHHHERWDGDGYPARLQGEAIPLGARIVTIADAFEVMTSRRVYQPDRMPAEALEELYLCAGTQFDPQLVNRFSVLLAAINLRPVAQLDLTSH